MYVWERHLGSLSSDEEFQDSYRGNARAELTSLFSSDRKRLLDVGCASGATSALLKEIIPGLEAWGVEPDPVAAQLAAQRLDKVFANKLEDVDLLSEGLRHGDIDAVLLADVLEHMYDPWRALVQLKPFLAPGAQVVISLPNVRNVGLVSDLVDGRFDYQKWGLLDITHIRFFTLDGAVRMLHEAGYGVSRVQANIDPMLSHVLVAGVPADDKLTYDRMTVSAVEPRELVEMCALQFFIVATPVQLEVVWAGASSQSSEAAASEDSSAPEHDQGEAVSVQAESAVAAQSHIVDIELQKDAEAVAEASPADTGPATGDGSAVEAHEAVESGSAIVEPTEPTGDDYHGDSDTGAVPEPMAETTHAEEDAPVEPEAQSQPDDEQDRQDR